MRKYRFLFLLISLLPLKNYGQEEVFPLKGISVNAPTRENVERFSDFIEEELAPLGINTIFLRIKWNYNFSSYPKMGTENSLKKEDIKKMLSAARKSEIELVPVVNLLGHQSWASDMGRLLEVFPKFDENPERPLPSPGTKMVNGLFPPDGFYCKSYCPLHPDVHKVVFTLIGEIIEVFEAENFHAGMDEVLTLADEDCPRCAGKNPAKLFAGEVNAINSFVKSKGVKLWIWGDRLIDANLTGMDNKSASKNGTAPAIDIIDKDVVISDWHYGRAEVSSVYFAYKGFKVATSPFHKPEVALQQLHNTLAFRKSSNPTLKNRFIGMIQTDWDTCENFMDKFLKAKEEKDLEDVRTGAESTIKLFKKIQELETTKDITDVE